MARATDELRKAEFLNYLEALADYVDSGIRDYLHDNSLEDYIDNGGMEDINNLVAIRRIRSMVHQDDFPWFVQFWPIKANGDQDTD
jgi:hypothetical protein